MLILLADSRQGEASLDEIARLFPDRERTISDAVYALEQAGLIATTIGQGTGRMVAFTTNGRNLLKRL